MHEKPQSASTRCRKSATTDTPPEQLHSACPACGAEIDAGSRFCPQCGDELPKPAGVSQQPADSQASDQPDAQTSPSVSTLNHEAAERLLRPLVGPNAPAPAAPQAETCSCGQDLIRDAQYCHECGTRVGDALPGYRMLGISPGIEDLAAPIGEDDVVLGKSPDCDLDLQQDEYASRRHARVSHSDRLLYLEDLGSSNGTFLRVRRPIVLEDGDEIVAGTSVFRIEQSARRADVKGEPA